MSIVNPISLKKMGCELWYPGGTSSTNSPKQITPNGGVTQVLPFPGAGIGIFDGSGDYLICGNDGDLYFNSDITVECYVCPTNINSTWQMLIGNGNEYGYTSYHLIITDTNKFRFSMTNSSPYQFNVVGPSSATDNAVVRFDNITGKLIQNSLVTINDTGTINIPTGQTFNINGSPHTHSYQPLDGDLTAIAGLSGTSGLLKKTASETYTLDTATYITSASFPTATVSTVGGIKLGTGLIAIADGTTSVSFPTATPSSVGGVKIGSGISITADGTISASGGEGSAATHFIQRTIPNVVNVDDVLMFWVAPVACTIDSCSMYLLSAPSGTSTYCRVQVMKNGVLETNSIFTSDVAMSIDNTTSVANGIYPAIGSLDSGQTTLASGDVIHFRVNQADVGSFGLLVQMKVTFT